jgi:ATP-dependent RNA helicase DDX21
VNRFGDKLQQFPQNKRSIRTGICNVSFMATRGGPSRFFSFCFPMTKEEAQIIEKSPKKAKKEKKSKKEESPEKSTKDSPKKSKKEKESKKRKREDDNSVIEGSDVSKKTKEDDKIIVEDQHIDDYRPSAPKKGEEDIPENLRLSTYEFSESTVRSLKERGINQLFPIQAASFGHVMSGKDLLGRARTGTGKTLAFSLPIVESLKKQKWEERKEFEKRGRAPRALIMAPTRELAMQVHKELDSICSKELVSTCVYGGVMYDTQYYAMKDGLDVIIGTPGRLIDHIERGNLLLHNLRFICLDEADQMLDIGFADDMERILKSVKEQKESKGNVPHQTLLFSATMPDWIKQAVTKYMKADKVTLDLIGSNKQKTSATVTHYCLTSRYQNRAAILGDIVAVYGRGNSGRTIIFVETKAEASELAMDDKLVAMGAQTLHGDIAQKQRETTMQGFRDGKFTVLITTNVCARGVDIPEVRLIHSRWIW